MYEYEEDPDDDYDCSANFYSQRSHECKLELPYTAEEYELQLIEAAESGRIHELRALLKTVAGMLQFDFIESHLSRLIGAFRAGYVSCVEMLLANKSKYYVEGGHEATGRFLLLRSAQKGREDCVKSVLDHGVDVNAWWFGETALHGASSNGHVDCVRMLLQAGADPNLKHLCEGLWSFICSQGVKVC